MRAFEWCFKINLFKWSWKKSWSMINASSIHSEIHMWSSTTNCFVMTLYIASKVVGSTCLHHPKKTYQEENTLLNARIISTCKKGNNLLNDTTRAIKNSEYVHLKFILKQLIYVTFYLCKWSCLLLTSDVVMGSHLSFII